ncbi:hypothetical protein PYCC9005_002206 [Savitreella phatthalungensis]
MNPSTSPLTGTGSPNPQASISGDLSFPSRLESTVRINVSGARIVEDEDTPRTGRDIQFPYHDEAISHIAIDIGGSLAKCVYFKRDADKGVRLNFTRFETSNIDALIAFLGTLIKKRRGGGSGEIVVDVTSGDGRTNTHRHRRAGSTWRDPADDICIMATGGGAFKFYEQIKAQLGVEVYQEDEMQCLIVGLDFFINEIPGEVFTYSEEQPMQVVTEPPQYPYLLVNIGSGVSMIKVSSPETFERIGGSSLGGGTLWGLLSLITGARSFDEMLDLSSGGDNSRVDMLVGDIYGQGYGKIGLKASTIASTFGKVFSLQKQHERRVRAGESDHTTEDEASARPTSSGSFSPWDPSSALALMGEDEDSAFSPEDVSRSLLFAISNNIGQIAYLQAQKHAIEHIYFGGSYIRGHPQTMNTLSYAIRFWSQARANAYFLRHEGYLGAVGAFLLRHQDWQDDWRSSISRRGSMEHNATPGLHKLRQESKHLSAAATAKDINGNGISTSANVTSGNGGSSSSVAIESASTSPVLAKRELQK